MVAASLTPGSARKAQSACAERSSLRQWCAPRVQYDAFSPDPPSKDALLMSGDPASRRGVAETSVEYGPSPAAFAAETTK
jgi:hypothetical protein